MATIHPRFHYPFYIAALRLQWMLPWAQLVSNTSYYSRNQYGNSDFTEFLNELYLGNTFPAPGTGGYRLPDGQSEKFLRGSAPAIR